MRCTPMSVIKKTVWIWIAIDRNGRKFIDFCLGNRSASTGISLWEKLKGKFRNSWFMTDYWKAYPVFIPSQRHIQSKAETFTVEGYNSIFRHFLARLRRKTKAYSKSIEMLELSLELLVLKRNQGMQSILN